jgi:hypothetical protein
MEQSLSPLPSNLPTLAFVSIESLLIHERHDDQRLHPLILRIRNSGVFRNPPIVSPLPDRSGRYMVLDGANRTTALKEMGFPHALVQIVQPEDPGLGLQNWNHVVWELNTERFVAGIHALDGIHMVSSNDETDEPKIEGDCGLALICIHNGEIYRICSYSESLEERVSLLNAVVNSYRDHARLDRTSSRDVRLLTKIYPQLSALVIFPNFKIADVMRLASKGYLLPSGITRFTISPRALHVNYPLDELAADKPLEEKNAQLHKWLLERIERKGVRYYAEPTFLFDE